MIREATERADPKNVSSARAYFQRLGLPIAAVATAVGGPIAIIRLSGSSLGALEKVIARGLPPVDRFSYRAILGSAGQVLDRALVLHFKAPHSFTGEDVLELHVHGVPSLVNEILKQCYACDVFPALPGEFSFRAVFNSKMSLEEAEALQVALSTENIGAEEATKLLGLRASAQSSVTALLEDLLKSLSTARGRIEAAIDFPEAEQEQGLELESAAEKIANAVSTLSALLSAYQNFCRAASIRQVVIVGEPNVGKSTLFNILSGGPRALVSAVPGTTRDLVESRLQLSTGEWIRLVDTAGLRQHGDAISEHDLVEKQGIQFGLEAASEAQAVIWVSKLDSKLSDFALGAGNDLGGIEKIRIFSHADKRDDLTGHAPANAFDFRLQISQTRNYLRAELERVLENRDAKEMSHNLPSLRQAQLIEGAQQSLFRSQEALRGQRPLELAGQDLLEAESLVQRALGRGVSEEYMGEIFAQFCLGK